MNYDQQKKDTQITESKKTSTIPALQTSTIDNELRVYRTRGEKILTALYMLTDLIESGDSLRNLLRKKGADMLASLNDALYGADKRHLPLTLAYQNLEELSSYLDIAYRSRFFSEMNYSVINNEMISFAESLAGYIQTTTQKKKHTHHVDNFESLFNQSLMQRQRTSQHTVSGAKKSEPNETPTQNQETQTLAKDIDPTIRVKDTAPRIAEKIDFKKALRSLSVKKNAVPIRKKTVHKPKVNHVKNERKEMIISILKSIDKGSINDICDQFKDCSSKTIQRDLIELIDEEKVSKQGSRRWSTYSVA
jgi:hypothetical protein